MKKIIISFTIVYLFSSIINTNILKSQETKEIIFGAFAKCSVFVSDYKQGELQTDSKRLFRVAEYNRYGWKLVEDYYEKDEEDARYRYAYKYDTKGRVIQSAFKDFKKDIVYRKDYKLDVTLGNDEIYWYDKYDELAAIQKQTFNTNRQLIREIETQYYESDEVSSYRAVKNNSKTDFVRDSLGNTITEIMWKGVPEIMFAGENYFNYIYDASDRIIQMQTSKKAQKGPNIILNRFTYLYNQDGNLSESIKYNSKDEIEEKYEYVYRNK